VKYCSDGYFEPGVLTTPPMGYLQIIELCLVITKMENTVAIYFLLIYNESKQ
jgi:hypothetical protein